MTRPSLRARVAEAARRREAGALVRRLRCGGARDGTRVQVDNRELVDFCGNDYLGLAAHPDAVAALREAATRHGVGSTGSHLLGGHHALHRELEDELADWLGYPRALLLGSGFAANLAVVQSLLGREDVCVQDRLNHASLVDAARLAGCRLRRYPHRDADAARRQLALDPACAALLATDGVFSMDGDVAPLPELAQAAHAAGALLYVDDAHGVGVVGADGRGTVAAAGLGPGEVPLLLVTLGKALGGHGAAVLGEAALVEHLLQCARPYHYTTASPPALAAASLVQLRLARREGWRREHLDMRVRRFRDGVRRLGLPVPDSATPIQPLLIGDNARTLAVAAALESAGFRVGAVRPPTVPEGRARLRITLTAAHTDGDIDALLQALSDALDTVAGEARPA